MRFFLFEERVTIIKCKMKVADKPLQEQQSVIKYFFLVLRGFEKTEKPF